MKKPGNWTIEGLFIGRTAAYRLFNIVRAYIESLGSIMVEAAKTQVSFGVNPNIKFAWVWLPQMWIKKQKENSITIEFDLDHEVQHTRIKNAVEPRPGRWTHHVVVEKESDFNSIIKLWPRQAHELAQTRALIKTNQRDSLNSRLF